MNKDDYDEIYKNIPYRQYDALRAILYRINTPSLRESPKQDITNTSSKSALREVLVNADKAKSFEPIKKYGVFLRYSSKDTSTNSAIQGLFVDVPIGSNPTTIKHPDHFAPTNPMFNEKFYEHMLFIPESADDHKSKPIKKNTLVEVEVHPDYPKNKSILKFVRMIDDRQVIGLDPDMPKESSGKSADSSQGTVDSSGNASSNNQGGKSGGGVIILPQDTSAKGKIIVGGNYYTAPKGDFVFTNYLANNEPYFKNERPYRPIRKTEFMIHETAGTTKSGAINALYSRNNGVHFIIDEKGDLSQHSDILSVTPHGNQHNSIAFGVEIVCPCDLQSGGWERINASGWMGGNITYAIPKIKACETLTQLMLWVFKANNISGLNVPNVFLAERDDRFWFRRPPDCAKTSMTNCNGILQHMAGNAKTPHNDGLFPTFYSFLRIRYSLPSDRAYSETKRILGNPALAIGGLQGYFDLTTFVAV